MLREIRMRGNFRAAFFLAEPVFPVALTKCGGLFVCMRIHERDG